MIITEFYKERSDGTKLFITRSSENKYIRKVGTNELYRDAIDIEDSHYDYEESSIDIVDEPEEVMQHGETI